MKSCLNCIFCVKESKRKYTDPYSKKPSIHIDCWKNHTWHNEGNPCEQYTDIGDFTSKQ